MKITPKLWLGIAILILLSPLGLLLPEHFRAGSAWGEWGIDEIKKLVGYVPQGFEKLSNLWNAPMSDYVLKGWEEKGLSHLSFAYIISAVVGIILVVLAVLLVGKILAKKGD
jgi:cobalt/nickel transport protein